MDAPMTTTEQSLAAIFAICDHVAESGEPIRTEDEARETARLGIVGQRNRQRRRNAERPNAATP